MLTQVTVVNLEVKEALVKKLNKKEKIKEKKKTNKKQLGNRYFDAFIKLKVSGFQPFLHIWQLGLYCYALLVLVKPNW